GNMSRAEDARRVYLEQTKKTEELVEFTRAQRERDTARRKTIQDLIRTSRELTDRHEYEEALGVVDQILQLDPRNDYAIGVRPLLQDALRFAEPRKRRERYD